MADSRVQRLAAVLVGYSADVQPGEVVTIEAPLAANELIVELYREVLRAGGHPVPRLNLGRAPEILYAEASGEQLDWVSPAFRGVNESADVRIIVEAQETRRASAGSTRRRRPASAGRGWS